MVAVAVPAPDVVVVVAATVTAFLRAPAPRTLELLLGLKPFLACIS